MEKRRAKGKGAIKESVVGSKLLRSFGVSLQGTKRGRKKVHIWPEKKNTGRIIIVGNRGKDGGSKFQKKGDKNQGKGRNRNDFCEVAQ